MYLLKSTFGQHQHRISIVVDTRRIECPDEGGKGGLIRWMNEIWLLFIILFHQSILQAVSLDVVRGCLSALMQYIASFPSTPNHHPEAIVYRQTHLHRTKPGSHFQRTMSRSLIRRRAPRRLCLLHYISRRCLWWSCALKALPRLRLEGYVISRHGRADLMMPVRRKTGRLRLRSFGARGIEYRAFIC